LPEGLWFCSEEATDLKLWVILVVALGADLEAIPFLIIYVITEFAILYRSPADIAVGIGVLAA
jgi:hypothetical protein